MTTRTRFAPSPTGYLHLGSLRTALFAWLLARQAGGQFILRLEDTDKAREVSGAADHVIESLKAIGLDYDEGPDKPGDYGPYVQSQRLDIYKDWANKLIKAGRAYADPYSAEEVQAFRDQAKTSKQAFLYRNHRPKSGAKWDGTQPLRFKSQPKDYDWPDVVMGQLHSGPEVVDDFILIKSDGYPTYNFAHIVDDIEMKISHVLRGQEFLASIPNYLNLYEALGRSAPQFATLPHVLGPTGQKKLSKRDGAKDVLDYLREGYLPEALISFMATLGWNDGTTQEVYSRDELVKKFSLARVQTSGAELDPKRLAWTNGHFIRQMPLDSLYKLAKDYWPSEASSYPDEYKKRVLGLVKERLKYLAELPELSRFFFIDLPIDPKLITGDKQLAKLSQTEQKDLLDQTIADLSQSDFSEADLTKRLNSLLDETKQSPSILFSLIRIATTQVPSSPGLSESLAVLGKDRSLARLKAQLDAL